MRMRKQVGFGRAKPDVLIFKPNRYHFMIDTQLDECLFKPRLAQFLFCYFADVVFGPKAVVIAGVGLNENVGRGQTQFRQFMYNKQLLQRFLGVFIKIPDGVIKVEEEVAVF